MKLIPSSNSPLVLNASSREFISSLPNEIDLSVLSDVKNGWVDLLRMMGYASPSTVTTAIEAMATNIPVSKLDAKIPPNTKASGPSNLNINSDAVHCSLRRVLGIKIGYDEWFDRC